MANHQYIVRCKRGLTPEKLVELAKRFNKEVFNDGLQFIEGKSGEWHCFKLGDTADGLGFGYEKSFFHRPGKDKPCVEIRHGHVYRFWWYVDMYFGNWLANELGAKIVDEGDFESRDPNIEKYQDGIEAYMRLIYSDFPPDILESFIDEALWYVHKYANETVREAVKVKPKQISDGPN